MKTPVNPLLLTTEDAASALGIGVTKTKKLISQRQIHSIKIGRLRRIMKASLDEYVQRLDAEQNGLRP